MRIHNERAGFTLIELLVVIAIIAILAGAAIMIINPVQQKAKANEVLMRSNFSKICTALAGCGTLKSMSTECDEFTELGVNDPTGNPAGSTYSCTSGPGNPYATCLGIQNGNGSVNCRYRCDYYFDNGTFRAPFYYSGTCVVN